MNVSIIYEISKFCMYSVCNWMIYGLLARSITRSCLKNRILVQDRGGAESQTGGILLYVEDLKRGTNKDIGPKDIFEMASNNNPDRFNTTSHLIDLQEILLLRETTTIFYQRSRRCR